MISVIMGVYNDDAYIEKAVRSVLDQSFTDFEFIIIDDGSTDKTPQILSTFTDKRIKFFRNSKPSGVSKFRNQGLKICKGKYVFFADSDAYCHKNWLKEGMASFKNNPDAVGVEGLTYYVRKGYTQSISDKLPGTVEVPGQYMGCNVAYTREILRKLHGFNLKCIYHSDREFALRALKHGRIIYCTKMIVVHQKKLWTVNGYIKSANRVISRVLMFEEKLDNTFVTGRVVFPKNLIKILIPPLILLPLFKYKNKSWLDYKLVLATYPRIVYQRLIIWKTAIKNKVFLI